MDATQAMVAPTRLRSVNARERVKDFKDWLE